MVHSEEDDNFEKNQMPAENYESPPVICKRLESILIWNPSGIKPEITRPNFTFD